VVFSVLEDLPQEEAVYEEVEARHSAGEEADGDLLAGALRACSLISLSSRPSLSSYLAVLLS